MSLKQIKRILIIGILITIISSGLQVFSTNNEGLNITFFAVSLLGQFIFAFGLYNIDKLAKSLLASHYLGIVCISFVIFVIGKVDILNNQVVILILSIFLLFIMLRYLQIFTKISGQSAFIYSFYLLIICIITGICVLKFGNLVENSSIVTFIIGFMVLPPLIYYIIAIFDLKEIRIYS